MEGIDQIIEELYNETDPETSDFKIFLKKELSVQDHYRAWLRILHDHMMFIMKRSEAYKQEALTFYNTLTDLEGLIIDSGKLDFFTINRKIITVVEAIRTFKQSILADLLTAPAKITLPPTFISHMLNELEKFRFIVHYVEANREFPPSNNLNDHELWLLDIVGHLCGIKDNLDPVEKVLRKRLHKEAKVFEKLHNKALEFIGYFKHGVMTDTLMRTLDVSSVQKTLLYLNLVKEIALLRESNVALGVIDRHMLMHMIFEEIYYMKCLATSQPNYDPLVLSQLKPNLKSTEAIQHMP